MVKKKLIIIICCILLTIVILSIGSYFLFIYGSYGELELKLEVIDENINVNTTFPVECTLTNVGDNSIRIVPFRSGLDIYFYYPNGTSVRYYGPCDGAPGYYNSDLIVLSPGEKITLTVIINSTYYGIDVAGNYSISAKYFSTDYADNITLPFWEGCVESTELIIKIK